MTSNPIRAVLFDMGGTLENLCYDDASRQEATRGLRDLLQRLNLDPGLISSQLHAVVSAGMEAYQAWREQSQIELPPDAVWSEYVLADHGLSRERLQAAAEELMLYYETHYYQRSLRPEAPAALEALRERGFRLAVISNVMSRRLVPAMLAEYGLAHYFDPVVTSAELGWRKPNARIFGEAARQLRLSPEACAYVGDTLSRDVIGARRAGYGMVIQIRSFLTDKADRGAANVVPDAVIHDLRQVVDRVGRCGGMGNGH